MRAGTQRWRPGVQAWMAGRRLRPGPGATCMHPPLTGPPPATPRPACSALFERATHLTLPPKKMKFLFKRYLDYEKRAGRWGAGRSADGCLPVVWCVGVCVCVWVGGGELAEALPLPHPPARPPAPTLQRGHRGAREEAGDGVCGGAGGGGVIRSMERPVVLTSLPCGTCGSSALPSLWNPLCGLFRGCKYCRQQGSSEGRSREGAAQDGERGAGLARRFNAG